MFRKEIIKWHKKVCLKIKCKILRGKKTIIYFIVYLIVMMKIIMLGLRNFVARSNDLDSNVLLAFLLTDAKQAKPLIWIFFIIILKNKNKKKRRQNVQNNSLFFCSKLCQSWKGIYPSLSTVDVLSFLCAIVWAIMADNILLKRTAFTGVFEAKCDFQEWFPK